MASPNRVRLVKIEIGPDLAAAPVRAAWDDERRVLAVWNQADEEICQVRVPADVAGALDVQSGVLGVELWLRQDA